MTKNKHSHILLLFNLPGDKLRRYQRLVSMGLTFL